MTDTRTNEQIIAEAWHGQLWGGCLDRERIDRVVVALSAAGRLRDDDIPATCEHRIALEASEAARANLEAVIAEALDHLLRGMFWDAVASLKRAGDPVVLREHDAKGESV